MRSAHRWLTRSLAGALALVAATTSAVMVAAPASAAPASKVEAEGYARQRGTEVREVPDASGGRLVDGISHGDWLRYDRVTADVGNRLLLCFSSAAQANAEVGTVDVRLGSRYARPVASVVLVDFLADGRQWASGGAALPAGVNRRVFLTVRQPPGAPPFALDYLIATAVPPPPSLRCS